MYIIQGLFKAKKVHKIACEIDEKWLFSHGQNFSIAKKSFSILFPSKYEQSIFGYI